MYGTHKTASHGPIMALAFRLKSLKHVEFPPPCTEPGWGVASGCLELRVGS